MIGFNRPFFAALLSFFIASSPVSAQLVGARVLAITDGDTIKVSSVCGPIIIRLKGIDAPEKRLGDRADAQAKLIGVSSSEIVALGKLSRDRLAALIPTNSTVLIESKGKGRDKYGRVIAYVYEPVNGDQINFKMVAEGWAMLYAIGTQDDIAHTFAEGERIARLLGFGVWATVK